MSVQSMACPKCGKAASEYDAGKWWCLNPSCQIKFVLQDNAPTIINNSTVVSTSTDSLYDLDPNGKKEHTIIYETISIKKPHPGNAWCWVLWIGGLVFMPLFILGGYRDSITGEMSDGFGQTIAIVEPSWALIGFILCCIFGNRKITKITQVPSHLLCHCPYCMNEFPYSGQLGLSHCTKCGKQFFLTEVCTWKIRSR